MVALLPLHNYTRIPDFLDDFARSLAEADLAIVTEIYASRERDTLSMSGRHIVEKMEGGKAVFAPSLRDAERLLLDYLRAGDVLLTMGAGDVWKVGEWVLAGFL